MKTRIYQRSARLASGLLVLMAVPIVLTWCAVRQEQLNQALIVAIKRNAAEAVIADLHAGADSNARDRPQVLPSFWERLRAVVMHRHDTRDDAHGNPALILALDATSAAERRGGGFAETRDARIVQALLQAGANPDTTNHVGDTPLMLSLLTTPSPAFRLLIDYKADVNAKAQDGQTALMWATRFQTMHAMRLLLEHGAAVNTCDNVGETSLIFAAYGHSPDPLQLLLEHHADLNARDWNGLTALAYAQQFGNAQNVHLLERANAQQSGSVRR